MTKLEEETKCRIMAERRISFLEGQNKGLKERIAKLETQVAAWEELTIPYKDPIGHVTKE